MRRNATGLWVAVCVAGTMLGAVQVGAADTSIRPLIYFSTESPNGNASLRDEIAHGLKIKADDLPDLSFGANAIGERTILIIEGSRESSPTFDIVSQWFRFLVRHAQHSPKDPSDYDFLINKMFHESKELEISCGKFSMLIREVPIRELGVRPEHVRSIRLYNTRFLEEHAADATRMKGGHALVEMYFPDLGKWVMMDGDAGVIPWLDGKPLSMFELSGLSEARYDEAIENGLERFGRTVTEGRFAKGENARRWVDALQKTGRLMYAVRDERREWYLFSHRNPEWLETWRDRYHRFNANYTAEVFTDREAFHETFYATTTFPPDRFSVQSSSLQK